MEDPERGLYAVQFHPEVRHTPRGTDMLKNFLSRRLPCARDVDGARRDRRAGRADPRAGRRRARDLRPLGRRRLRRGRAARVPRHRRPADVRLRRSRPACARTSPSRSCETFGDHFHVPLVHVEASERFLAQLAGVTDPETKRMRIGETFIRVFEEESRRFEDARFLVQGTLYSDVIESGSKTAAKIKSHHNVGGLPDGHGPRAVRAAALAVQGRGARASARSSACPTRSSGASRSRGRASRSASSARSRPSGSRSCATPTP